MYLPISEQASQQKIYCLTGRLFKHRNMFLINNSQKVLTTLSKTTGQGKFVIMKIKLYQKRKLMCMKIELRSDLFSTFHMNVKKLSLKIGHTCRTVMTVWDIYAPLKSFWTDRQTDLSQNEILTFTKDTKHSYFYHKWLFSNPVYIHGHTAQLLGHTLRSHNSFRCIVANNFYHNYQLGILKDVTLVLVIGQSYFF